MPSGGVLQPPGVPLKSTVCPANKPLSDVMQARICASVAALRPMVLAEV